VQRLVDACATVSGQFGPVRPRATLAGRELGSATTVLEPLDAALRTRGPAADEQRGLLSLLARSLDHLAECLQEISADASRIKRTRVGFGSGP
jgi:hypothetical protein